MMYGLIGEKLSHSYSQTIHELFGNKNYILKEVAKNDLDYFLLKRDFMGINVTIPYKKEVIKHLSYISDEAKKIGSVNAIVNKNGKLYGYNTDYYGFLTMSQMANISFNGKKVLILGSGGTCLTAKAVASDCGASKIVVVSREGEDNYDNIYKHYDSDIVINTTPVGMYPQTDVSPLNLSTFKGICGVIDVIYNPTMTKLLYQANEMNIPNTNGLSMLVFQALMAHNLFFDTNVGVTQAKRVLNKLEFDTKNIVLVGMPGSGKSTVAKLIGQMTGREVIDTDLEIEKQYNLTIPQIFERFSQQDFRQTESRCIMELCKQKSKVIATGGGAVINTDNIRYMRQNSTVVFVKRDISRLATVGRPLSKSTQELEKMYQIRLPMYKKASDFEVDINENPEKCAKQIMEIIKQGIDL